MTDRTDFTMPADALRRHFRIASVGTLAGILLFPLFGVDYFSSAFWWAVAILLIATLLAYIIVKRQVYISLTPEGIIGNGNTGRKVLFRWSDDLLIERKNTSGWEGIQIRKKETGIVEGVVGSVFVPMPVIMQEGFMNLVERYAPENHPLRSITKS